MVDAYCMKCKAKREMKSVSEKTTSRGVKMAQGTCSVCGTKMCKMLGK